MWQERIAPENDKAETRSTAGQLDGASPIVTVSEHAAEQAAEEHGDGHRRGHSGNLQGRAGELVRLRGDGYDEQSDPEQRDQSRGKGVPEGTAGPQG